MILFALLLLITIYQKLLCYWCEDIVNKHVFIDPCQPFWIIIPNSSLCWVLVGHSTFRSLFNFCEHQMKWPKIKYVLCVIFYMYCCNIFYVRYIIIVKSDFLFLKIDNFSVKTLPSLIFHATKIHSLWGLVAVWCWGNVMYCYLKLFYFYNVFINKMLH